jgi:hypothetical protein
LRGDNGAVTLEHHGDAFDRYTVLSLGADGVESADDITFEVAAFSVSSLAISSISGAGVAVSNTALGSTFSSPHSAELTLKGYNFGAVQATSKVMFGATELSAITSWSDELIVVQLPESLAGTDEIYIEIGAAESNHLTLTILPNSARAWKAYR